MWIRSLDKRKLIFCKAVSLQYTSEGGGFIWGYADTGEDCKFLLGVYKAEQAGKVLDNIQATIRGSRRSLLGEVYEMPKELVEEVPEVEES